MICYTLSTYDKVIGVLLGDVKEQQEAIKQHILEYMQDCHNVSEEDLEITFYNEGLNIKLDYLPGEDESQYFYLIPTPVILNKLK